MWSWFGSILFLIFIIICIAMVVGGTLGSSWNAGPKHPYDED